MWHRGATSIAEELIGECEAFLAGTLVEVLELHGESTPTWAWSNLLAHASDAVLHEESVQETDEDPANERARWRAARSYLAKRVLEYAAQFGPLEDLQRAVLIPLELDLAASPETEWVDPPALVMRVERSLAAYGRSCSRARATSKRTG